MTTPDPAQPDQPSQDPTGLPPVDPRERTQRLDGRAAGGPGAEQPISYTEDYAGPAVERTLVSPGVGAPMGAVPTVGREGPGSGPDPEEEAGRTWSTTALAFTGVIALLVGVVLALVLLPEEEPLALDDTAAQQALADNAVLQADNEQLRAELAARDAEISRLQAEAAGNQAEADQAAADRQAALDDREEALDQREAAVAQREEAVAQREEAMASAEGSSGGPSLPDIGVDLPSIDEEQARGVIERLVDRLQDLFGLGGDDPAPAADPAAEPAAEPEPAPAATE